MKIALCGAWFLLACLIGVDIAAAQAPSGVMNSDSPKPELSFPGIAKPRVQSNLSSGELRATVRVLIQNSGPTAKEVAFDLFLNGRQAEWVRGDSKLLRQDREETFPGTLEGFASSNLLLVFTQSESEPPREAVLQASVIAPPEVKPAVAELVVDRSPDQRSFWLPVLIAALAGALYFSMTARRAKPPDENLPPDKNRWRATVHTDKPWAANDSWATNITALGAVLATTLGASGFLPEILPGISTAKFVGLSLFFGSMVIVAPVVYIAFGDRHEHREENGKTTPVTGGTVFGMLLASGLVVFAIVGQLVTLYTLLLLATSDALFRGIFVLILLAVALLVGIYAYRSVLWQISVKEPPFSGARSTAPAGPGVKSAALI